jgi:hypothetical protein
VRWTPRMLARAGYATTTDHRAVRVIPVVETAFERALASLHPRARERLTPEQRVQIEIVAELRPRVEACGGKLLLLGGELPGGSKLFRLHQFVRRLMGYEAGQPDLLFLWPDPPWPCRVGVMEVKRPAGEPDLFGRTTAPGDLSTEQRRFRDWSRGVQAGWARPRTLAEATAALDAWGMP